MHNETLEIINTTLGEYSKANDMSNYEIWDERTKKWVVFGDSCYAPKNDFPSPELAEYPINVLTVFDTSLDAYFVWVLKDPKWCAMDIQFDKKWCQNILNLEGRNLPIPDKINFFLFDDESDMLEHYLKWHCQNYPDVISGWNVESFDMPYLLNRMKLFFDEEINAYSPTGKVTKISRDQRGTKEQVNTYKISGISILDYLLLYKYKFNLGSKPNHKLGDRALDELGYGKLTYQGTFKEFYRNDFKTFVGYNIVDVMLCVDMDKKLQYLELARTICNIGLCEYEGITKSSPYIVGAIALQAHTMGKIIITDSRLDLDSVDTSFEGAYVFPTTPAVYRRGVASIDLNSLYPNVIINLNISPETKIGKIISSDNEGKTIKFFATKEIKKIPNEMIPKLFGKVTISANGILYMSPERQQGILPAFCERLYNKRKEVKKQGFVHQTNAEKLSKALKTMKNSDSQYDKVLDALSREKTSATRCRAIEQGFKCYLNSLYGQLGSKYFPMFDIDNAEAVTISGQKINKGSAAFVNKFLNEKYGTDKDFIASGDTDSIYFDTTLIADELFGKDKIDWNKENVTKICDYLDNEMVPLINQNIVKICREEFLSPLSNIEYKREKFSSEACFVAKKRYIAHVRNDEGIYLEASNPKSWKCTGVDIKKNELPGEIKLILEDIIYKAIEFDWDNELYMRELNTAWIKFLNISPSDIAWNKGYNTEKKVKGFLASGKGAGLHAKAAQYHNQIIEKLKLKHKYDEIRVGNHLRFVHVNKSNAYGVNVIGWLDQYPEEFNDIFEVDYKTMFKKVVMGPIKGFAQIFGWSDRHPADDVIVDLFSL